ncbi:MAG: hypothetical protein AMXMBFR47_33440 [Planctomycetota bacterium]
MTIEKLKRALESRPFRPFRVNLADGRSIPIRSPEFAFVPPKAERTFWIWGNREDDYTIVDLLLVTSLDFGNGAGHGTPRRKTG